jgi:hypothetical protein
MSPATIPGGPLSPTQLRRLTWAARLPLAWTATPRRRRLLVLALAAPGFGLVTTTPLHHALALLALGAVLFALALAFRRRTEPVFVSAEAAELWPPPSSAPPSAGHWELPHA